MKDRPQPLLSRVLATAHALEAELEADLGRAGLSLAKLGVLRALHDADQPLTLGGIAERVQCVRSNVTQLVDRLEADGLVLRGASPADRRAKHAQLTRDGKRAHDVGVRILQRHEAAVAGAAGNEAARLGRLLARLRP